MNHTTLKFNPHHNVTSDGVEITEGLQVWTNDLEVGTVVRDDDSSEYKCCLADHPTGGGEKRGQAWYGNQYLASGEDYACPKYCRHDHWFTVRLHSGLTKMFNGERLGVTYRGRSASEELKLRRFQES